MRIDHLGVNINIEDYMDETNKADLNSIKNELGRGQFSNVLTNIKQFHEKHVMNEKLEKLLITIEAISLANTGKTERAKNIVKDLYQHSDKSSFDELFSLGNLAYLCDKELTKEILSTAVSLVKVGGEINQVKLGQAYMILGLATEELNQLNESINHFEQCISLFSDHKDQVELVRALHIKLISNYSTLNETEKAMEQYKKLTQFVKKHGK